MVIFFIRVHAETKMGLGLHLWSMVHAEAKILIICQIVISNQMLFKVYAIFSCMFLLHCLLILLACVDLDYMLLLCNIFFLFYVSISHN